MSEKILVLDDEKEIAEVIALYLRNEGYEVEVAHTGLEALKKVEENPPKLALLDVMLPDIEGFRVLQKIREKYRFPVIMLTAKTEDGDKITGLTLGADDYIAKPFNPLELVARVKAQLRRYMKYNGGEKAASENIIDFAGLVMNRDTHECIYNERELMLTPIEFDILWLLCENRERSSVQSSCLSRYGRKNISRTVTIRLWYTSGICGRKWAITGARAILLKQYGE